MTDDDAQSVTALKDLLGSDGWRAFTTLVETEWGPAATLTKIDTALAQVNRGDTAAISDTVQQIQASRREVFKALALPSLWLAQARPARRSLNPMELLRRTHR